MLDFNRLGEVEKRARAHEASASANIGPADVAETDSDPEKTARLAAAGSEYRPPPPKRTFVQNLALYSGTYSSDPIIKMVLSTVVILTNIGASWTIFVSGLLVAWYVAISFVSSQLLYAPPYNFNAAAVGYTSVGPLVGGIFGSGLCSLIMDPMLKWLTRLNKGV